MLFDADGMVLKRHQYFSVHYAETHNANLARIDPFFKTVFQDCLSGRLI